MQLIVNATLLLRALLILLLMPASVAMAQENPLSTANKGLYGGLKKILVRSAELMPEEHYGYKPTEDVRSFGQIVGHLADSQYFFCSAVLLEKNPSPKVEKTKTSKADLIAALKDSIAYCDRAYDGMTDATALEKVKVMGGERPKLSALNINQMHAALHYGNLITYMRMKGVVPPSSDPDFMQQLMK